MPAELTIRAILARHALAGRTERIDVRELVRRGDAAGRPLLHRLSGGAGADRSHRLAGAPLRSKPARQCCARTPAAACRDRCRHRRWTAPPCPDPPRQCRASSDDRRAERPRGRAQYRARGFGPRCATRPGARRACRRGRARQTPTIENGWPLQPATEPAPRVTPLPIRLRPKSRGSPPEPGAAARARPTASPALPPNLSTRLESARRAGTRRASREAPARTSSRRSHEPAAQADHNLAEMAHRLEAALRRAPAPEGRPPVTDPWLRRARALTSPHARRSANSARAPSRNSNRSPSRNSISNPRLAPSRRQRPARTFTTASNRRWRVCWAVPTGKLETTAIPPPRPSRDGGGRCSGAPRRTTATAVAQDISINFGQGGGLTERVIQLIALLTVLSLAPSILIMMTSFTRIVVVLSLLRTALGTATAPPNAVIVSLALFLTAFVMGPALQTRLRRRHPAADRPTRSRVEQAFERASEPFKRLHAEERAREGPQAVHRSVAASRARPRPRSCRCASWCRPS